ncbi:hypothetical protein PTI98_008110 [Pleurotus ostreatus]|nr:hypothetical protein PTI98_008110 [Pleurotus ostreatus]
MKNGMVRLSMIASSKSRSLAGRRGRGRMNVQSQQLSKASHRTLTLNTLVLNLGYEFRILVSIKDPHHHLIPLGPVIKRYEVGNEVIDCEIGKARYVTQLMRQHIRWAHYPLSAPQGTV